MKMSISCKELGIDKCTFEARSEVKNEVRDALVDHAQKYHPEMMKGLSEKENKDLIRKIESSIK
jgi:predicted small metal-binding protein